MKTILFIAISLNGKITVKDKDTSWVSVEDIERMDKLMLECGVMIMGSETYSSFGEDLPNDKAPQIVVTQKPELLAKQQHNVTFTNKTIKEVLADLETNRLFKSVLIAGGAKLNTSLIKEDLIDEIRLIVKPIVIGEGKAIFNDFDEIKKFNLISVEHLSYGAVELKFSKQT